MTGLLRTRWLAVLMTLLPVLALTVGVSASHASSAPALCGNANVVGDRIPLLFVHGFISDASAWDEAVDRFCRDDRVYASAFDYSGANDDWVTDPEIGPALATEILRLANASRAGGGPGKVLLVGHSMGGLAIRCAADGRCNGGIGAPDGQASPVANVIGAITTFGTPNHGSFLRGYGLDGVANDAGDLLSAVCHGLEVAVRLDPIDDVCDYVRAFGTGDAAEAFTPGSAELKGLWDQPEGVPVLAVAGHSSLTVPLFWNTVNVDDLGDYVVSAESAQAQQFEGPGFGGTHDIDCGGFTIGVRYRAIIPVPVVSFADVDCWHMSEPNNDTWLDQVQDMIDWFTKRPLSALDLLSAPVPALCSFQPGRLVNGQLPEQPASAGQPPTLVTRSEDSAANDLVALGDLDNDGAGDAAAVVNCNAGGVGWPDNIVFWSGGAAGPTVLGAYQMGDAVGDARSGTTKLTYTDGSVTVESLDSREGDAACCPTGSARVTLEWDGREVVATNIEHLDGSDPDTGAVPETAGCDTDLVATTVCDFVRAVESGDWSELSGNERAVAVVTTDLPDTPWMFQSCELVGDITLACRVIYATDEPNSESTAATFYVQPIGGEYDPNTGAYNLPPGVELDYEVTGYGGLGV